MAAAVGWVLLLSEYFCTALLTSDQLHGRGEALIGFGLWCLFLWWLSKRYSDGWTFYWFIFALVSYAPFADMIDAGFGGVLGLSTQSVE